MKILFICGCLEKGKNGVGDYTLKLAAALKKNGYEVAAIGLNDRYVEQSLKAKLYCDDTSIDTLRIPRNIDNKARMLNAELFLDDFNPQYVSLQYVSFSFHPKGLPFDLPTKLKKLGKGVLWHIMFHELWVGMGQKEGIKYKLWGKVQKLIVLKLLKKLNPIKIHTQCELFLQQLEAEKVSVTKLPLFSNIGLNSTDDQIRLEAEFKLAETKSIKFIFFGGLHPESVLEGFIQTLKSKPQFAQHNFEFIYIGRSGEQLKYHKKVLEKNKVKYSVYGDLPEETISYMLKVSHYGVSTGSPEMLDKNGTVSAMVQHGLRVICIGRNLNIKNFSRRQPLRGIIHFDDWVKSDFDPSKMPVENLVEDVAKQFIKNLVYNTSE